MASVDEFNRQPEAAARHALRDCCSSGRWIDAMVAGRPYRDLQALVAGSDAAVAALTEPDLREALDGHPRIGDRRLGPGWSGQEQAGVSRADAGVRTALDAGNRDYEQRFGHIYLACATGRSATELLEFLRGRLGNDRATEWETVRSELAGINRIRLGKLAGAGPGGGR